MSHWIGSASCEAVSPATRPPARRWEKTVPLVPMAPWVYGGCRAFFQFAFLACLRVRTLRHDNSEPKGGYVLACTHLSHLDPLCATVLTRRKIDWMARIEFFRWKPAAWFMRALDVFSVDRRGVPVKSLRTAIERTRNGRIVGVFPEGGVAQGKDSACRGGAIKRGACFVACYSGVPIVPCVIVGTDRLNRVWPWLPLKRGRLWMAFGEPIAPRPSPPGSRGAPQRRWERAAMAEDLRLGFMKLYAELRAKYGIDDSAVP